MIDNDNLITFIHKKTHYKSWRKINKEIMT